MKGLRKRKILFASGVIILIFSFIFSRSRNWFFIHAGQHEIDFSNTTGEFEDGTNNRLAYFEGKAIPVPVDKINQALVSDTEGIQARTLGQSTVGEKRIEIDLTNQRLYAYEGENKVFEFIISTGKPWWPTPTGEFRPWIKLRYKRMRGGSKALGTYYDLPNVPFVMFFANGKVPGWKGYAIHGTYWHNNFGHPMSHGCVNLSIPDAEKIYYWADPHLDGKSSVEVTSHNPGTRIIIYGETPKS
jgi:lipoprotein-anchoring transpeptidase ErfK/SrfK